jgi:signal transduction histidine kinase
MKLGQKIILPLLFLLITVGGSLGYVLYRLEQQQKILSAATIQTEKTNALVDQLTRQQYQIEFNVLAYRFKQENAYLQTISSADVDIAHTLDKLALVVTAPQGRALLQNFIDAKRSVIKTRSQLILDITDGNTTEISYDFTKWSLQIQNIRSTLADINGFNINSIEAVLVSTADLRTQISEIIILLVVVILVITILVYLFFNELIVRPIVRFSREAAEIARGNFTTTLHVKSRDEIGALGTAFSTMAAKLKESYAELEEKVAERTCQLAESEERLNSALSSAKIGAWDLDLIKDTSVRSLQHDQIFGYTTLQSEWGTKIFDKHIVPEDLSHAHASFDEAFKSGILLMQCRIQWPDKSIHWIEVRGSVQYDKKKKPIRMLGTIFNIDREKEIDTAKTEFVSLASHQLRTPLSAVNWYTEMLLDGDAGKINVKQKKYLAEIYNGNQRMVALVNALLNVSRLELGTFAIEPTTVDMNVVAAQVIDDLKPQTIQKEQTLTFSTEEVSKIVADEKLLRMVIQNLLANAVKYTPEKGKISLVLKKLAAGTPLEGRVFKDDSTVIIVSDTGYGIPLDQQERIFTKLFRADNVLERDTEGTGLGLYIVKSIVTHAGGEIWFTSVEDGGTTFYVVLPASGMKQKPGDRALS